MISDFFTVLYLILTIVYEVVSSDFLFTGDREKQIYEQHMLFTLCFSNNLTT